MWYNDMSVSTHVLRVEHLIVSLDVFQLMRWMRRGRDADVTYTKPETQVAYQCPLLLASHLHTLTCFRRPI